MSATPAELRALADRIESEDCTGIAAQWCPVHGDCTCPPERVLEHGEWVDRILDKNHPQCPLHGLTSSHAEAIAQDCGQRAPVASGMRVVHHINGNPYDNRPENLQIMDAAERSGR